jgi:hypothetical protein
VPYISLLVEDQQIRRKMGQKAFSIPILRTQLSAYFNAIERGEQVGLGLDFLEPDKCGLGVGLRSEVDSAHAAGFYYRLLLEGYILDLLFCQILLKKIY